MARQIDLIEKNCPVLRETRVYCPDSNTTKSMRSKEEKLDYRYVPDPDLLPLEIEQKDIDHIKTNMPKTPTMLRDSLLELGLAPDEIEFFLTSPHSATIF